MSKTENKIEKFLDKTQRHQKISTIKTFLLIAYVKESEICLLKMLYNLVFFLLFYTYSFGIKYKTSLVRDEVKCRCFCNKVL